MPIQHLCVLATARSGTNYLCNLLADNLKDIRYLGEVLCPEDKFSKKVDNREFKQIFNSRKQRNKKLQLDLEQYINIVSNIASKKSRILLYKILYYQITTNELEIHLKSSKSQYPLTCLLLHRNPLDSYISNKKALRIKKWRHIDTTDIKVKFDSNTFQEHVKQIQTYETNIKTLAKKYKITLIELNYEDIHQYDTDEEKMSYILSEMHRQGCNLLKSRFQKQDRAPNYQDKVKNYPEMIQFLKDNNYTHLLPK